MVSFYSEVTDVENVPHVNFSSIEHYRSFVKELKRLYKHEPPEKWPKDLNLRGTVKLHGTHADIVYTKVEVNNETNPPKFRINYQSRNRVLTLKQDNCGFARFMESLPMNIKESLFNKAIKGFTNDQDNYSDVDRVFIAGEFCGGNIQKGVALSQLPLMFVVFGIKVNDQWLDITKFADVEEPDHNIYNICRGGVYRIKMDLNNTEGIVSELARITDEVEKECPFAKPLGASGIGEGVVWVCEEYAGSSSGWFKVKGDEHAVSRVKTLKEKSEEEKAQLKNVAEFVKQAVREARLRQGLDYLREMNLVQDIKNIGTYIQWVVKDVLKEEMDVITEMGLDVGKVKKAVTPIASSFYKNVVTREKMDPLHETMEKPL